MQKEHGGAVGWGPVGGPPSHAARTHPRGLAARPRLAASAPRYHSRPRSVKMGPKRARWAPIRSMTPAHASSLFGVYRVRCPLHSNVRPNRRCPSCRVVSCRRLVDCCPRWKSVPQYIPSIVYPVSSGRVVLPRTVSSLSARLVHPWRQIVRQRTCAPHASAGATSRRWLEIRRWCRAGKPSLRFYRANGG